MVIKYLEGNDTVLLIGSPVIVVSIYENLIYLPPVANVLNS